MTIFSDLFAIVKHGGIALDEEEAAMLGAPAGETLSLWTAMEARHGVWLAHVACLALYVVQWRHCHDQLAGVPMGPGNYLRAGIGVLLFFPITAAVWLAREIVRRLP